MSAENEPRVWSEKYPPVNRKPNLSLGPVTMLLLGASTEIRSNPNELAMLSQTETLELGSPTDFSMLSGDPGYIYKDDEVSLVLSLPEMYRFLKFNLRPEEYFKLARRFGVFYAISGKWYDEDTGIACQPFTGKSDYVTFMQRCMAGEVEPEAIDQEVEAWNGLHEKGCALHSKLHEHLGMREDEYAQWMADPSTLFKILFYRMRDYGARM